MKKYIRSFFILSVVISLPFIFFIFIGLTKMDIKMVTVFLGIMIIYWSVYFQLKKEKKYFFWISFVPILFLWILLFIQEIRRVLFIFENIGMEKANGLGSPLAFLLGMSFELILFIPLSYAFISGILYLRNKRLDTKYEP